MKKPNKPRRYSLTLLLSLVIFIFTLTFFVLSNAILDILSQHDIIAAANIASLSPLQLAIFAAVFSVALSAVASAVANHYPLSPITTLIEHLNRLASGDFKTRLKFQNPQMLHPEFGELTDSFNQMAQELENTEMLRSDFINNFSHEFKTPIVSIAGFAKLLRRGNLSAAQQVG